MRSAELFAGCGGLAFGLSRAGFKPAIIVECDADTVRTLRANKEKRLANVSEWPIDERDVRHVDFRELRNIALISGGPPCQPFSIGGKHLGQKDPRNMWPEAIRAVRQIMPDAFIFENVRGLLRPAFSRYLDYIVKQLEYPHITAKRGERWTDHLARLRRHAQNPRTGDPAYRVMAQPINAADYGAPQKRYRTLIMGLATRHEEWSFPKPTHSQAALVWSKHVSGDYWDRHDVRRISEPTSDAELQILRRLRESKQEPRGRPWRTVRDVLSDLPPAGRRTRDIQGHWQHPGARVYANHTGSDWDEPAKALKAGDHGVPGGENVICNRRGSPRYFTIREMARLQCLPDNFAITGSWKAATRQLGNAVPAVIGEHFGRAILNQIS